MFKLLTCAVALAASLPTAAATSDAFVSHEVVRFDDLNLASAAGVATLERRINSAARRVCGRPDSRGSSFLTRKSYSDCVSNALVSARKQVAIKTGATILKG
jgi:UrcA family protein